MIEIEPYAENNSAFGKSNRVESKSSAGIPPAPFNNVRMLVNECRLLNAPIEDAEVATKSASIAGTIIMEVTS